MAGPTGASVPGRSFLVRGLAPGSIHRSLGWAFLPGPGSGPRLRSLVRPGPESGPRLRSSFVGLGVPSWSGVWPPAP